MMDLDQASLWLIIWVCLAVALIVIEIFTAGFFFFFFGIGAIVTAAVAFFVPDLTVQLLVFVTVSTLLVLFARPMVKKIWNIEDKPKHRSNVDALAGSPVLVLDAVDALGGRVKVLHTGETWSAVLAGGVSPQGLSDNKIPSNAMARIVRIDGAKLVVEPAPKEE